MPFHNSLNSISILNDSSRPQGVSSSPSAAANAYTSPRGTSTAAARVGTISPTTTSHPALDPASSIHNNSSSATRAFSNAVTPAHQHNPARTGFSARLGVPNTNSHTAYASPFGQPQVPPLQHQQRQQRQQRQQYPGPGNHSSANSLASPTPSSGGATSNPPSVPRMVQPAVHEPLGAGGGSPALGAEAIGSAHRDPSPVKLGSTLGGAVVGAGSSTSTRSGAASSNAVVPGNLQLQQQQNYRYQQQHHHQHHLHPHYSKSVTPMLHKQELSSSNLNIPMSSSSSLSPADSSYSSIANTPDGFSPGKVVKPGKYRRKDRPEVHTVYKRWTVKMTNEFSRLLLKYKTQRIENTNSFTNTGLRNIQNELQQLFPGQSEMKKFEIKKLREKLKQVNNEIIGFKKLMLNEPLVKWSIDEGKLYLGNVAKIDHLKRKATKGSYPGLSWNSMRRYISGGCHYIFLHAVEFFIDSELTTLKANDIFQTPSLQKAFRPASVDNVIRMIEEKSTTDEEGNTVENDEVNLDNVALYSSDQPGYSSHHENGTTFNDQTFNNNSQGNNDSSNSGNSINNSNNSNNSNNENNRDNNDNTQNNSNNNNNPKMFENFDSFLPMSYQSNNYRPQLMQASLHIQHSNIQQLQEQQQQEQQQQEQRQCQQQQQRQQQQEQQLLQQLHRENQALLDSLNGSSGSQRQHQRSHSAQPSSPLSSSQASQQPHQECHDQKHLQSDHLRNGNKDISADLVNGNMLAASASAGSKNGLATADASATIAPGNKDKSGVSSMPNTPAGGAATATAHASAGDGNGSATASANAPEGISSNGHHGSGGSSNASQVAPGNGAAAATANAAAVANIADGAIAPEAGGSASGVTGAAGASPNYVANYDPYSYPFFWFRNSMQRNSSLSSARRSLSFLNGLWNLNSSSFLYNNEMASQLNGSFSLMNTPTSTQPPPVTSMPHAINPSTEGAAATVDGDGGSSGAGANPTTGAPTGLPANGLPANGVPGSMPGPPVNLQDQAAAAIGPPGALAGLPLEAALSNNQMSNLMVVLLHRRKNLEEANNFLRKLRNLGIISSRHFIDLGEIASLNDSFLFYLISEEVPFEEKINFIKDYINE